MWEQLRLDTRFYFNKERSVNPIELCFQKIHVFLQIFIMSYVNIGKHNEKRESILVEHLWVILSISSSEGIRSDKWKYFRYRFIDAPEELYDLEDDPMEINNLALDPTYNMVLHIFRRGLDYKIRKYTDSKLVSDFTPPEKIDMGF